jgi:hypothetical protein
MRRCSFSCTSGLSFTCGSKGQEQQQQYQLSVWVL